MVLRPSTTDLRCWKYSQLTCYLIAFLGGVVASATLGTVVQKFDGRCPFYTNINFQLVKSCPFENCSSVIVSGDDARLWEAKGTCDFSIFTAVAAAIYAFILAYFILMCDRTERISQGSGSHNRMTNLFFPLLITSLVFSCIMLASSVRALKGTNIFCHSIEKSLNISCDEAQYYHWKEFALNEYFYVTLLAGLVASWISTCAYFLSVFILILRCSLGVDYSVVYMGKLIESQSLSQKSISQYGSGEHSPAAVHKTSSLPYSKQLDQETAGPSSSSI